jgi:hypothetical protein
LTGGGRTLAGSIEAAAYRGRITHVGSAGRDALLQEAAAAHAYVESRQAFGRVLLIP